MLEILVIIILGVFTGLLTGLTPGLHPNTVIFSSMPFYFGMGIDFILYASFISGISVSHTFHDFIPSIFLGVPEPDSALAALPGQAMALRGRGVEAFIHTVYGGVYSMLVALPAALLFYFILEPLYGFFSSFMHLLLLFFLLVIVLRSENEFSSIIVAVLAGSLGLIGFGTPVNQQYILIPVFGGLFAFPSVWNAVKSSREIPEQRDWFAGDRCYRSGGFLGFLASIPVALFPGTTASVATTFLWPIAGSRKKFLSAVGGVNTSDIFLSFLTLMVLGRARSGASVAVQTLGRSDTALFVLGASLTAVAFSAPLSIFALKLFIRSGMYSRQKFLASTALIGIFIFSFFLTGPVGILVFLTSASIGFFSALTGNRHSCMAVLLVPSIIFLAPPGFI